MTKERTWIFYRRHDDTGGEYTFQDPPTSPTLDARPFASSEVARMQSCPVDYFAADARWKSTYGCRIPEYFRRFVSCLPIFMSTYDFCKRDAPNTVRANDYFRFLREYGDDELCGRSLRTVSERLHDLKVITLDREANADILFFTAWQKHQLLVATSVVKPDPSPSHLVLTYKGVPLAGPAK
ncbi:hypothetical protein [Mesorhizobium sp.]|uniref:hypothetical protein n=1 Tax=Mesorhizobium sp. TaxID=1871066 RepID=UPI000FE99A38|nr:hypothetical protein [Mesorhizobium sp.]RWM10444.1 MAG: hypothetical protein EOR71_06710 [Mesorhizobium sp.]